YERLNENGLTYFVNGLGGRTPDSFITPAAGSLVRFNSDYGAMKIDASDTTIDFQFITRTGIVIDSYTMSTVTTTPTAPTGLNASTLSSSQIELHWTDNSTTETGFEIERSTDGVAFSPLFTVGANINSYTDTDLTSGATYFYRVRASNKGGSSAFTT